MRCSPVGGGASRRVASGAAAVEVAFALPILLTFIFALVDLGMWTLNVNQATNAARDGARAAILGHAGADVPGSDAEEAVLAAVNAHLDRAVEGVEIDCVDPAGVPLATCAAAQIDVDRVRVEVEWGWTLLTPVAVILGYDEGRARGSATMSIVGRPRDAAVVPPTTPTSSTTTTTPDPAACGTTLTVSPAVVATTGQGASQLRAAVVASFTTNGSVSCNALRVELYSSHGAKRVESVSCGCGEGPTSFSWSYAGSDNAWKPGTGTVNLYNGPTLLDSETFSIVEGSK